MGVCFGVGVSGVDVVIGFGGVNRCGCSDSVWVWLILCCGGLVVAGVGVIDLCCDGFGGGLSCRSGCG